MMDFLADTQWLLWIGVALILGLLELISLDFVFSMLVVGCVAAAGVAYADYGFTWQALAFVAASVVGIVTVRPALKRWLKRSSPQVSTNTDALVGRSALTVTEVTDRGGQVKLAGEVWSARTAIDELVIPADTDVVVVEIDGATAIVGPRRRGSGAPPAAGYPGADTPPAGTT